MGKVPEPNMSASECLAVVKSKVKELADPFKSAVLRIPDGTPASFSDLNYRVTSSWDNRQGRVTLAGDAAHSLPPRELPMQLRWTER